MPDGGGKGKRNRVGLRLRKGLEVEADSCREKARAKGQRRMPKGEKEEQIPNNKR